LVNCLVISERYSRLSQPNRWRKQLNKPFWGISKGQVVRVPFGVPLVSSAGTVQTRRHDYEAAIATNIQPRTKSTNAVGNPVSGVPKMEMGP
jgi:hypothetical protein